MGDPKSDWGPTRDPKRNAEIDAKIEADRRREAAYLQRLETFKALRQKELEAFKALRQKELPGMEKYINQHIPILLGAWQQQVDSAITDAPYPSQEQSRVFWYIALGGNLLWAATCFINPASGAIVIMSVVGAAVGSGGVEKLYGSPPTNLESAKDLVRQQVAKARGELEKHFQKKRREWASGFSRLQDWSEADESVIDLFNGYMWEQMFPWIKYDTDRFDRIRRETLELLKRTLADYNKQWQKFLQDAAWYGEAQRKKHNIVFRPRLNIRFGNTGPSTDDWVEVGKLNVNFE